MQYTQEQLGCHGTILAIVNIGVNTEVLNINVYSNNFNHFRIMTKIVETYKCTKHCVQWWKFVILMTILYISISSMVLEILANNICQPNKTIIYSCPVHYMQ